ncbi:hypothetical protein C8R44DRAFT_951746 [Mycena epipterygia]|nr:hypothetical protein C8R44DRAFT_951746 [Mycena epipterygia]
MAIRARSVPFSRLSGSGCLMRRRQDTRHEGVHTAGSQFTTRGRRREARGTDATRDFMLSSSAGSGRGAAGLMADLFPGLSKCQISWHSQETPEESGEPAFQILRLPDSYLSVRFFCGASPPGMLFFDFVDARTGHPVNLPAGYKVLQRMPEKDMKLVPMHEMLFGPDGNFKARFALKEGTCVLLQTPNQQEHHFQSPITPLANRPTFRPTYLPTYQSPLLTGRETFR